VSPPTRVLVLGGTGQLGSRLARRLAAAGHEVVATTRGPAVAGSPLTSFDPWHDDWASLGTFAAVVNAIGAIEERGEDTFERVHVELAERLIAHHHHLGAPRLLHLSALGARPDHPSPFLASKGRADLLLLAALSGAARVLRPSIVLTPGTRLIQRLRRAAALARCTRGRLPFPKAALATRLQPVLADHLTDLATALLAALFAESSLATPAPILEVVGAEVYTVGALLDRALAVRGLPFHPLPLPLPVLQLLLSLAPPFLRRRLLSPEELRLLGEDNLPTGAPGTAVVTGGPTAAWLDQALL
jgi:uncharacterized protein YbjT (DUF2867 family)